MRTFKEKFEESKYHNDLYEFIEDAEDGKNPLGLELLENNDKIEYDSYGNEDSKLERIFFDPELNVHVKFYGRTQSYNGTDWSGYKIVEPKTKTVHYFEEV